MRTHAAGSARAVAAAAAAACLALLAAACGSSGSAAAPAASASGHAMAGHHAMSETAAFGPDCGMVPGSGMGSFHSMKMTTVVTAAMHNPLLTAFAADVRAAGLSADLNSMHPLTIFAPANSALHSLPASEQSMMMHSHADLAKILKYHVVSGRVTPAELASGRQLKTLEGGTLKGAKMGSVYEVNKASVLCGNIQTANATVYVISKVLMPAH